MRLPLKFLPRKSQLILDVIGSLILLGFGGDFFSQYAAPSNFARYDGFRDWLRANPLDFPFMLCSIALLLIGLAWFTVAIINLASNSPFNYLIVDRVGITYRNFWRENRYAWKNLGPIEALLLSAWQGRSSQRRHWIVADATDAEFTGGFGPFWSNPPDTLRIPASVYLGGGMLIGTLDLATNDAAAWLEEVRRLARDGKLDGDELPPPPSCFRAPIEVAAPPALMGSPER
jgi:hypothetical protein